MYSIDDYNYSLPEALIAQVPVSTRDQSRLMVLDRKHKGLSHCTFSDLPALLSPDDLLVINNTRVVPARLRGRKETGGRAEVLLLSYPANSSHSSDRKTLTCECLVKTSKPPRPESKITFEGGLEAVVLGGARGRYDLRFQFEGDFDSLLEGIGRTPLPPYIERDETKGPPCNDRACYQTVYAEKRGAVAAPTAGLHFSEGLLKGLGEKGVETVSLTLHVGYGTFLPVRARDIREHKIHSEAYELTEAAARVVNKAKDDGKRIVAVGTTAVRVLEFASKGSRRVQPGSGPCDLYIFPGYEFGVIDGLITNFHLPQSTLLMLVAAFADRDFILKAYEEAIRMKYRFYSYGDAMLIL
jgi:S-adenosylmethionine:tRNA ribosyltransferase-isomerase